MKIKMWLHKEELHYTCTSSYPKSWHGGVLIELSVKAGKDSSICLCCFVGFFTSLLETNCCHKKQDASKKKMVALSKKN